jgi:hypothetical protein
MVERKYGVTGYRTGKSYRKMALSGPVIAPGSSSLMDSMPIAALNLQSASISALGVAQPFAAVGSLKYRIRHGPRKSTKFLGRTGRCKAHLVGRSDLAATTCSLPNTCAVPGWTDRERNGGRERKRERLIAYSECNKPNVKPDSISHMDI